MLHLNLRLLALLGLVSIASGAAHLPNDRNAGRRHGTTASTTEDSKKPQARRPNPFPPQRKPSSFFGRVSELGEQLVSGTKRSKIERDPRLGPGPGYAASLKQHRDSERRGTRRNEKRQEGLASSSPTATATGSAANPTSSSNSSAPVWLLDDVYTGDKFFDYFQFYNYADPTNGLVTYVDSKTAFANGLAYVQQNGKVIMKADNVTQLPNGQPRNSVRIQSYKEYTGGLFILDLDHSPFGCGVWPAFWTSNANWPTNGEIDIYEGVHLSTNNQVTWHTSDGCTLKNPGGFSGVANTTDCYALINNNAGCAVTDQSYSSSGATLRNIGGGVFAMKWDTTGISVWFFPREVIPDDILSFTPDPTLWGTPTAHLSPDQCDLISHFQAHSIIFNITFCGDWAGMTYLTSGCPGTCNEQIANPANLNDAFWVINTLRVYTNSDLQAGVLNDAEMSKPSKGLLSRLVLGLSVSLFASWVAWW